MALEKRVVVLLGGVGGAKLALGLMQVVKPDSLTFIVNCGDDFWRLGLKICPDLDTLMYTLSGSVDAAAGWGLAGDSTVTLQRLATDFAIDAWFRLGDKDLATHLVRTHLLRQGYTLTAATACLAQRQGIRACLLPMSDAEVPTIIETVDAGELGFQEYFVKHRWAPAIRSIRHQGFELARLSPEARDALASADIVLIAPSNPWLSLAPILSIPGLRALLMDLSAPVVAVTPIVAGAAVKGPTAKIMAELGIDISGESIADYYGDLIDGFVDDIRNEDFRKNELKILRSDTLMTDLPAKVNLARAVLDWVEGWAP